MRHIFTLLLLILNSPFIFCGNYQLNQKSLLTESALVRSDFSSSLPGINFPNQAGGYNSSITGVNPLIKSYYPGSADFKIPDSLSITISFVKPLDNSTVKDSFIAVFSSFYGKVSGTVKYDDASQSIVFLPERRFHPNELISVSLTPGVKTLQNEAVQPFNWTFTASPISGSETFALSEPVPFGDEYGPSILADMNNDGLVDVLCSSFMYQGIFMMKNLGGLKFSRQDIYLGKPVDNITTGDFDGDGKVDIAFQPEGEKLVVILKQMPDGSFQTAAEITCSAYLGGGFNAADLDADGKLDISICSNTGFNGQDVLLLFRNMGNMRFQLAKELPVTNAQKIIFSDIDLDGYPDIIDALNEEKSVCVFRNSRSFNFSAPVVYPQSFLTSQINVADFNHDGYPDILASGGYGYDYLSILINDSTGNFKKTVPAVSYISNGSCTVGDLNNDTYPDIAIHSSDYLYILKNNSNLSFTESKVFSGARAIGDIGAADLDNDGDIDLYMESGNPRNLVIAKNKNAEPEVKLLSSSYDFGVTKPGAEKSAYFVVKNDGVSGTLNISGIASSNEAFTATASKTTIAAGDTAKVTIHFKQSGALSYNDSLTVYSNDKFHPEVKFYVLGRGEQVLSCYPKPLSIFASDTAQIRIYFNVRLDAATLSDSSIVITGSHSGRQKAELISFDDGLKLLTIKTAKPFRRGENVTVSLTSKIRTVACEPPFLPRIWDFNVSAKSSSMSFRERSSIQLPQYSFKPVTADFNNDGLLDVAVLTQTNEEITIYKNEGDFRFTKVKSISIPQGPQSLAAADFDNDGRVDIAVCKVASKIQLLKNTGNFNFTSSETDVPGYLQYITAGDYDNDGLTDLAVGTGSSGAEMEFVKNMGNFIFKASKIKFAGIFGLASEDIDGDGDLDILADIYTGFLLRNNGNFSFQTFNNQLLNTLPSVRGDFNNDGLIDFAAASYWQGYKGYEILVNNGDLKFTTSYYNPPQKDMSFLAGCDFDGDSTVEFLSAASWGVEMDKCNKDLKVVKQLVLPPFNFEASNLLTADFDNDGDIDLLAYKMNSPLTFLENRDHFSEIALSPTEYNFGSVQKDSSKTFSFTISNPGSLPLVVDSIYCSSKAFSLFPTSLTVEPRKAKSVTVTFTPMETKAYSDSVVITSNDKVHPAVKFMVTGMCRQVIVDSLYPAQNSASADPSFAAVRFTEDIIPESLTPSSVFISGSMSGFHNSRVSYDAAKRLLSIVPEGKFITGEEVEITLKNDFKLKSLNPVLSPFIWRFIVKAKEGTGSFRAMNNIPTGQYPKLICSSDLENDGVTDMIVSFENGIAVIKGSLDSKPGLAKSIALTDSPFGITAGDFNNDGKTDIAAACRNSVIILKNEGGFNFTKVSVFSGQNNRMLASDDLDGDGDLDLIVTNDLLNTAYVLENQGNFTFRAIMLPSTLEQVLDLKTGDMDNDGDIDIVISKYAGDPLCIFENTGNMSFKAKGRNPGTPYIRSMVLADMNHDTWLDLASGQPYINSLCLIKNLGGLQFFLSDQQTGADPLSLTGSDYDSDGDIDLASVNNGYSNQGYIYTNQHMAFKVSGYFASESGSNRMTSGDFNGDGAVDIAYVNEASGTVGWLLNVRQNSYSLSSQVLKLPDTEPLKSVSNKITIKNTGLNPFTVDSIYVKNKIFSVSISKTYLARYDSAVVTVTFKPDSLGSFSDTLYIVSKVDSGNQVLLQGRCVEKTAVTDRKNLLPVKFELGQNYPNPFNPSTSISFALPAESYVRVRIINLLGRSICLLADKVFEAGYHEVRWSPVGVSSGIYFYSIEADPLNGKGRKFTEVKKMIFLK